MNRPKPAPADNPWVAQTVEIAGITPEVPGVATYHLRLRRRAGHSAYGYRPGQFNMLYVPGVGEMPISLSAGAEVRGTWDHTIRLAGSVTHALAQLKPGATLGLRGPYGSHWPLDEYRGHDIVLVAGGIGMAPLRPLLYQVAAARENFAAAALLYGARSPETLLYLREHDAWQTAGITIQTTVDRATASWHGNIGPVPLLLDRLQFNPGRAAVFVCGPEVMMRYSARSALARGVAADRIWVSLERNMQCAAGFCGHCQLGPEFVCKDGPVFRYDRIVPWLTVESL